MLTFILQACKVSVQSVISNNFFFKRYYIYQIETTEVVRHIDEYDGGGSINAKVSKA